MFSLFRKFKKSWKSLKSFENEAIQKSRRGFQFLVFLFAVYLCPTRNTLFLTTVERAVRTHGCHRAESNVQCTNMTCGWSGTNTPPDEGGQHSALQFG